MAENPTIEELKAPLLAAVGAADLALATVNEIVVTLRERAEEARTEATARAEERRAKLTEAVDETRGRITKLQEELPKEIGELREKLNSDELRKAAETYADAAQSTYNKLIERGEAALERLRNQPTIEDVADRVEGYADQAVELTQDALGTVASQTRAVGERAAKLVGVELPKKAEAAAAPVKKAAAKAPAKKAPAKKAPAKKAPAKKATQK
jgi:heparin binding hemagglutinin HbhA